MIQDKFINLLPKTYHVIRHCTNGTCPQSSKLQSTRTNSCLPFTPKHSSILSSPLRPRIPISSRCVLWLSACFLIVRLNGRWNEWLCVSCSLTAANPKPVTSVYVSEVKFRSELARLVSQICPHFVCHQSKINCVCWGRELAEFRLSSIFRPTRYLVQQNSHVSACGLIVPGIIDPKA